MKKKIRRQKFKQGKKKSKAFPLLMLKCGLTGIRNPSLLDYSRCMLTVLILSFYSAVIFRNILYSMQRFRLFSLKRPCTEDGCISCLFKIIESKYSRMETAQCFFPPKPTQFSSSYSYRNCNTSIRMTDVSIWFYHRKERVKYTQHPLCTSVC